MNRILLILLTVFLSALGGYARETVKGTVVDSHGDPLPGVKVEVPGTSQYVFTDLDGMFQIILRDPVKKLDFSYPGLGTTSHRVSPEMKVKLAKGWAGREKGYRGMIDIEGGMGINGNVTIRSGFNEARNIHTMVLPGFTTTHGYQFNKHLFVGLGIGYYLDFEAYEAVCSYGYYSENPYYSNWRSTTLTGIHVPAFVAARWDFGLAKKTAPYIDLRIGYDQFIGADDGYIDLIESHYNGHISSLDLYQENLGSVFIAPSIGYRIRLSDRSYMNLGIRYMAGMKKTYTADASSYTDFGYTHEQSTFTQRSSDIIMFTIGAEF